MYSALRNPKCLSFCGFVFRGGEHPPPVRAKALQHCTVYDDRIVHACVDKSVVKFGNGFASFCGRDDIVPPGTSFMKPDLEHKVHRIYEIVGCRPVGPGPNGADFDPEILHEAGEKGGNDGRRSPVARPTRLRRPRYSEFLGSRSSILQYLRQNYVIFYDLIMSLVNKCA